MLRLKIKGLGLSAENEIDQILSKIFTRFFSTLLFLHFRRFGFGARDQFENKPDCPVKNKMIIVTLFKYKEAWPMTQAYETYYLVLS